MGTTLPQPSSILRSLVLAVALLILLIGLAIAQTTPPATPPSTSAPQTNRDFAAACRGEIKADLGGDERREAMRACVMKKREAAGLPTQESRKIEREKHRAEAKQRQEALRSIHRTCREGIKDQRLTETERRDAIETCMAKDDPKFAKFVACRKEATEKKLERGTKEFREYIRTCQKAA